MNTRKAAFTLIEGLVAIGMVVVLTTLALALARPARTAADDTSNLNNLRLTGVDFAKWSLDHQEKMVTIGMPNTAEAAWFFGGQEWMYLAQMFQWPRILQRHLGETHDCWQSTRGPAPTGENALPPEDADRDFVNTWQTRYLYAHTMRVRPDAYTFPGQAYPSVEEFAKQFLLVTQPMITNPAAKGILVERDRPGPARRWHVLFADGRSASVDPADAVPPAAIPSFLGEGVQTVRGQPVLETLDGCRGADFR